MTHASMPSPALEVRGLAKSLEGRTILDSLDMAVGRGEVVSLVGASGSGKTTLLRAIAGLATPDDGEIRLMGKPVWTRRLQVPVERREVGLVFQDYALWPHMTVEGNLRFGLDARRLPRPEVERRVSHALEATHLGALRNRRPSQLSGGQQQRVAIARCLAARPKVLLLDEPLSNLDALLRDDLRSEMMRLIRAEGITAVYVTHDQAEAMAVSDRLAVMDRGAIAQFATPQQVYDSPASAFVARFLGGFSLLPGRMCEGVFRSEGDDARLRSVPTRARGDVVLVVRPEDARQADAHPENQVRATVVDNAFQGRCWRLTLKVREDVVRVDWPRSEAPGTQVTFSMPPERCTVLPP